MNDVAEDNAAISFASGLYIGMGEGKAIEQAFDDAMIVIETEHSGAEVVPEVWLNGEKMPW